MAFSNCLQTAAQREEDIQHAGQHGEVSGGAGADLASEWPETIPVR